MLEVDNVHTYYGESYILQGISIHVPDSSIIALLGRNGAGKTTTIRSIVGFTPPRSGGVRFKGESIISLPPYKIAQMGIGLVPQGRRIFPSLSVEENLTMSARKVGGSEGWSLDNVYAFFPGLKMRAKKRGNLLSGGEQQMLTIGRALMTNPDLLLMDEPSEGLAPVIIQQVKQIIHKLKKSGISILLVEQNLPLALAMSDYTYILSKGLIVYASYPKELRDNEDARAKFLGATG